jgi:hypothetical protein
VRAVLEDNVKLREKSEARFQAFFDKELNRLKNDFRNEAEVRHLYYTSLCACVTTLVKLRRFASVAQGFLLSGMLCSH